MSADIELQKQMAIDIRRLVWRESTEVQPSVQLDRLGKQNSMGA